MVDYATFLTRLPHWEFFAITCCSRDSQSGLAPLPAGLKIEMSRFRIRLGRSAQNPKSGCIFFLKEVLFMMKDTVIRNDYQAGSTLF
jgi:hypothetical protein